MFAIIRTGEGEVPGGEQEEPNTNIDVEDFLNMTGDGMGEEESDGREEPPEDESDDCDDDGNVVVSRLPRHVSRLPRRLRRLSPPK